jgi:hypothetical protein
VCAAITNVHVDIHGVILIACIGVMIPPLKCIVLRSCTWTRLTWWRLSEYLHIVKRPAWARHNWFEGCGGNRLKRKAVDSREVPDRRTTRSQRRAPPPLAPIYEADGLGQPPDDASTATAAPPSVQSPVDQSTEQSRKLRPYKYNDVCYLPYAESLLEIRGPALLSTHRPFLSNVHLIP